MKNEPISSLTHFIGLILSIVGLVLLIVFAKKYGNAWHVVSFSIFGSSLILAYLASSLYHIFPVGSRTKRVFRRIDHAMIYMLIAGTYTPVCLVALRGGWGWSLFGVVWGLAVIGIVYKTISKRIGGLFNALFYLTMGWLIIIALVPLMRILPVNGLWWLITGGIAYTIGTIFLGLDSILPRRRWFGMHEIFHLFVLIGSFSHFWVVFKYILYI